MRLGKRKRGNYQTNGGSGRDLDQFLTAFTLLLLERLLQHEIRFNVDIHLRRTQFEAQRFQGFEQARLG